MKLQLSILALILAITLVSGGCPQEKEATDKSSELCNGMTLTEAKLIAESTNCSQDGLLKNDTENSPICNDNSKTWWMDLDVFDKKQGCNPACVVDTEKKQSETNWRCTGLILP